MNGYCFPDRLYVAEPGCLAVTCIVNTQCDRVDAWFIGVSAIMRFVSPTKSRFSASSSLSTLMQTLACDDDDVVVVVVVDDVVVVLEDRIRCECSKHTVC